MSGDHAPRCQAQDGRALCTWGCWAGHCITQRGSWTSLCHSSNQKGALPKRTKPLQSCAGAWRGPGGAAALRAQVQPGGSLSLPRHHALGLHLTHPGRLPQARPKVTLPQCGDPISNPGLSEGSVERVTLNLDSLETFVLVIHLKCF